MINSIICWIIASILMWAGRSPVNDAADVDWSPVLLGAGLLILVLNILCIVHCRLSSKAEVQRFEAIRETITNQRAKANITDGERQRLTKRICKMNARLALRKYYAKSLWTNWYYHKSILQVKPIE